MKKGIYLLLALLCSIFSFGQGNFYISSEVGIQKNLSVRSIAPTNFGKFQNHMNYGVRIGYSFTNNLALESGLNWANTPPILSYATSYSKQIAISQPLNGMFSIPLHLKISHSIIGEKLKLFTFFGPSLLIGTMNNQLTSTNYNSGNYENTFVYGKESLLRDDIGENEQICTLLFDGGVGLEYSLGKHMSIYTKSGISLGRISLNKASFQEDKLIQDLGKDYITNKWKGDNFNVSLGLKYRF